MMTHEQKYTVILDVLAEKIKSQEQELSWKTYQVQTLQEKLEKAEEIIAEYKAKEACNVEEREG